MISFYCYRIILKAKCLSSSIIQYVGMLWHTHSEITTPSWHITLHNFNITMTDHYNTVLYYIFVVLTCVLSLEISSCIENLVCTITRTVNVQQPVLKTIYKYDEN